MKKVVPTLLLILAVLFGKAQTSRSLWFNELIPGPSNGDNEYIEFYNSSRDPIALDCYFVVSYVDKLPGKKDGVYIYDFPGNAVINGLSRYLISSGNPINFKGGTYTPSDPTSFSNWNSSGPGGSLLKYTYNNGWGAGEYLNTDFNDFIADAGGMDASLFLFKTNSDGTVSFVNGFVANPQSSDVVALINHLKTFALLPITPVGNCFTSTVNIDFNLITYNNIDIISLTEAPGTGNGYAKKRDGLCGNWDKTSQGQHTPGTSNNYGIVTSNLTTTQDYSCNTVNFSTTTNGSTTYPITVQLFYDKPQTGFFEATDEYITSKSVESPASASNTFTVPISSRDVLLVYQSSLGCLANVAALTTTCSSVLPVHFRSFTANRNKQKREEVALKWETASEQNNRGFNVQRNVSGEWKNIAFIKSQASNGNSATTLSYEYTDINTISSAIQYRVQQVDWDGKVNFSDVRVVMNSEENRSIIAYPNPGINGKVNVLFKEINTAKQVIVYDTNGRLVQQFPQVKDTKLTIEGLPIGFYTLKVIDRSNLVTSVQKVIIQ